MVIGQEQITGDKLLKILEINPYLQQVDIKYTILYLLEKGYINPSKILDAHNYIMEQKYHRMRCHYEDACVTNHQILGKHFSGKELEKAKKRASFNTSFSTTLPKIEVILLTDEERKYWGEFFKTTYDFDPNDERE